MLRDDFYSVVHREHAPGSVKATVSINADHKILKGHFPSLPVVPGVCMMQMIVEIMEDCTLKSLHLATASSIKFLTVISPERTREVDVAITYTEENGQFAVRASLFAGSLTFFKLTAGLKVV